MEAKINHSADTNFEQGSRQYTDYSLARFLEKKGYTEPSFSIKKVTLDSGEIVPLVHIEAINDNKESDFYGEVLNYDIWPRQHATYEDVQKGFPEKLNEVLFRLSWTIVGDEIIDSNPKWLVLNPGTESQTVLHGPKREFEDSYEQKPASESDDEE